MTGAMTEGEETRDAKTLVERLGGTYEATPTETTDYRVVGEIGWPLKADGRLTHHLEEAHRLRAGGGRVAVGLLAIQGRTIQ